MENFINKPHIDRVGVASNGCQSSWKLRKHYDANLHLNACGVENINS